MESLFLSIDYKDPLWIAVAFFLGFLLRLVGLPPMVGFLLAGFTLNFLGADGGTFLYEMADLGVTLLLFTIGLKLRVKELLRAEVWAVTLIHILLVSGLFTLSLFILAKAELPLFASLDTTSALVIAFAMSFSSTVFVVKVLEAKGGFRAQYGRLAIGILVVQDLAAVIFLAISQAKIPSIWASLVILCIFLGRPLLFRILDKIGHGELLVLFGIVMALGGASLFEAVDMKADLGALVMGVLLAASPKSEDLAKALFSIKELFLVGFFLSIGMAGLPDMAVLFAVGVLLIALVAKSALFYLLFCFFRVRARSAASAAIALCNYSEFGLIVSAVAVSEGWLSSAWLVTMAVLVACSFVISSALNNQANNLYTRWYQRLQPFERPYRLQGDEDFDLSRVKVLVCGMGRVGCSAYEHLRQQWQHGIIGLDFDEETVRRQCQLGRDVHLADVSNPDFWSRIDLTHSQVEWILLSTPNLASNTESAKLARQHGFAGFICASVKYPEEEEVLLAAGVNTVFNIYAEAGAGLAQHGQEMFDNGVGGRYSA